VFPVPCTFKFDLRAFTWLHPLNAHLLHNITHDFSPICSPPPSAKNEITKKLLHKKIKLVFENIGKCKWLAYVRKLILFEEDTNDF
jgi:hypothetical protein